MSSRLPSRLRKAVRLTAHLWLSDYKVKRAARSQILGIERSGQVTAHSDITRKQVRSGHQIGNRRFWRGESDGRVFYRPVSFLKKIDG